VNIPNSINKMAVIILRVFLGSFSATLLPTKTFNPVIITSAKTTPKKIDAGAEYLAANNPEAICVLSPNSPKLLKKTLLGN